MMLGYSLLTALCLTGVAPDGAPLTSAQLETIWANFNAIDDEGTHLARAGMKRMVAAPDLAVPFLRDKLKPVKAPDAATLDKLLEELDSNDFKTREQANQSLEKLGVLALGALKDRLKENPGSLEAKNRMTRLIDHAERATVSAEELRAVRGIFVLRAIGGSDAKSALEALAKGADETVVTRQARKALATMK
ncbi:MAG: hypothetical protein AB7K24_27185 [Gemmataceae bacterium]